MFWKTSLQRSSLSCTLDVEPWLKELDASRQALLGINTDLIVHIHHVLQVACCLYKVARLGSITAYHILSHDQ